MSEQFEQLLKAARLSRSELAQITGVHRQTVSAWSRKGCSPLAEAYLKERAEVIRLRDIVNRITEGEQP